MGVNLPVLTLSTATAAVVQYLPHRKSPLSQPYHLYIKIVIFSKARPYLREFCCCGYDDDRSEGQW